MFEVLVFIFGIYALIFGSVRLPWKMSLEGWRARIAGLFLMAPLPILIMLGRTVSQGIDRDTAISFYGMMEVVVVILGILGAVLFAYLTRPAAKQGLGGEDRKDID